MPNALRIKLDNPCHQNWHDMKPVEDGRYCRQCCKTVVDFSSMTDREILDYISRSASSNLCGRVENSQLNRNLEDAIPRRRFSLMYLWQMLVAAFLMATDAKAQGSVRIVEQHDVKKKPGDKPKIAFPLPVVRSGTVISEMTGEPVPFASIVTDTAGPGLAADSSGRFEVPVAGSVVLQVSAVGFLPKTETVMQSDSTPLVIFLSPDGQQLEKVTVVGYGSTSCERFLGGIMGVRSTTIYEKIERTFFRDNSVRVFPNPTPRGNRINVSLQLKEAGEYRLDLMDAGGRMVWWRTVQLHTPQYAIQIDSERAWSAGVYWLRVSARHTKKIFHGKIVLQ